MYIPKEVKDQIKIHIASAIEKAKDGYISAYEDEDVLTGQLFGLLKHKAVAVDVRQGELKGNWKWEIDYKKFRGRGKGATESIIGADGIIEFHLDDNSRSLSKSLLFQSKVDWQNKDTNLYSQCSKLIAWLGAAVIINYTQEQFETYSISDVFSKHGVKPANCKKLIDTIGDDFLDCQIGDSDLKYDAVKQELIWLNFENKVVSTKFVVNRKLRINVQALADKEDIRIHKKIGNSEIFKNRLKSGAIEEIINGIGDLSTLKKKQAEIAKAFHPDRHQSLEAPQIDLLNDIMKLNNSLFDQQREYIKTRQNQKEG